MNLFKVHSHGTTYRSMPCCFSIPIAFASLLCIYFSLCSKCPTSTTALCPASTLNSIHYEKSKYDSALSKKGPYYTSSFSQQLDTPPISTVLNRYILFLCTCYNKTVPFSILKKKKPSLIFVMHLSIFYYDLQNFIHYIK